MRRCAELGEGAVELGPRTKVVAAGELFGLGGQRRDGDAATAEGGATGSKATSKPETDSDEPTARAGGEGAGEAARLCSA